MKNTAQEVAEDVTRDVAEDVTQEVAEDAAAVFVHLALRWGRNWAAQWHWLGLWVSASGLPRCHKLAIVC